MSVSTSFKRVVAAAGVFAGLGLIVLGLVSYLISADAASRAVMADVKAATGFKPTVRGPVSVSVFPSPRVTLGDVALTGTDDDRHPPLTVERLIAHVRWLPLLMGRFDIADIALDHPHITLSIDAGGHSTWSPLVDTLSSSVRAGSRPGAKTLSFSEVRITDGVFVIEDGTRGSTETFEQVELSLAWPSIARRFAATGRLTWRDEPLDIALTIADFPAALAGDNSGLKVRLAGTPIKLAFDGAMSYLPSVKIDGTLAADTSSLRETLYWISGKRLPGSGLGVFSLKARANMVGGTIALSDLNVELDGNVAEGVLTYATRGRRALQGTLALERLDLTPYAPSLRLLAADARTWDSTPISLDWFDGMDFDLRISAARVIAAQGRLGRTAVAATLRDGRLLVTVGESQGFNGLMSGSLAIAKTDQGAHLRSQLQLTDVDLETCLADLFGVRRLEGKGSLSLGIDAEGRSVLALARNVNGSAELVTSRGVLAGFNVEQLLRRLERRPLAGSADFRTGRTPFESLRVNFRIKQGTASLEQGRIEGTNVRLALSGSASIPARDFDLNGTASLLHVGEAPPAFELPFFVQGSWDDPIVLPDTQALIRRSGAAAPLLDAVIDQRAREAVHSAIDRMIEESAHAPRTGGPPPIPFEPPAQANIPAEQPSR